jgi:transcriptional regulator with XRE-family HTH domain
LIPDVRMYVLRVKEAAQARGFNISSLSRASDVPIRTVRQAWNNPHYKPSLETLEKLAEALKVRVEELIHYIPDEP